MQSGVVYYEGRNEGHLHCLSPISSFILSIKKATLKEQIMTVGEETRQGKRGDSWHNLLHRMPLCQCDEVNITVARQLKQVWHAAEHVAMCPSK